MSFSETELSTNYVILGQPLAPQDFLIHNWNGPSPILDWSAENAVEFGLNGVQLTLDDSTDGAGRPFDGAAVQSVSTASYGTWSWVAQAPEMVDGAIFAMFLYKEDWQTDPWLEFDFEFVGEDTTEVHLAVHMEDDEGNHVTNIGQVVIELGFDAADDMHLYQITVGEGYAAFLVDGELVYRFTAEDMPEGLWNTGGLRSFTSLWATDRLVDWAGEWAYPGAPLVAEVAAISTPEFSIAPDVLVGLTQPDATSARCTTIGLAALSGTPPAEKFIGLQAAQEEALSGLDALVDSFQWKAAATQAEPEPMASDAPLWLDHAAFTDCLLF